MRAIAWRPEHRVSDRERVDIADRLRHACGEGYLSAETLEERIDSAFHAKRRFELVALINDLPRPSHSRIASAWLDRLLGSARNLPDPPRELTPPPGTGDGPFVIGRARTSDLWIDDPTVSKHHADLRRTDDGWVLTDVRSRNGTRVNGWKITEAKLRAGDLVLIGDATFVFGEPS